MTCCENEVSTLLETAIHVKVSNRIIILSKIKCRKEFNIDDVLSSSTRSQKVNLYGDRK